MAARVSCPRCGTGAPSEARICPKCGTALTAGLQKPPPSSSRPPNTAPEPRAPSTKDSLIGQKLQEYVIEERIGAGGMGNVYRAVQPMIGKQVAIKVLRPEVAADPRDIDRLLQEARVVNAIKHRGIINIFGAGSLPDGRHYLVMELLEGESLEQVLQREGKIAAADAVAILGEVLSALAAAHEAGIVHRDLKPANVFLVKEGGKHYVKLVDFGLARRTQQNVTRVAGTPDYISPEHARGRPAGPPADLYAVGVLCFHMLTGELPFIGNTAMEVMEKHVRSPPPVPNEVNPEIPVSLSELILKLLAKDPAERPDALQVKADLRVASKQLRTASTLMSLPPVEPVTEDESKRARKLEVEARLANVRRQVSRKWPLLTGVFIGVWLLGVVVYLVWPRDPATTPVKSSIAHTDVKPPEPEMKAPRDEVRAARPPASAVPPAEQPVAVAATAPEPVADSGELAQEDLNAPLDDFRLAEEKQRRHFDEDLDSMRQLMGMEKKKKLRFEAEYAAVKKRCEDARTLKELGFAEDDLNDLKKAFYAN